MDRQNVVNRVIHGLSKQGFCQSVNHYGMCLYRGTNGAKCAIGHLILDGKYEERFDTHNTTCRSLYKKGCLDIKDINVHEGDLRFLDKMQKLHDESQIPGVMRLKFKIFVETEGLEWPLDD